MGSTESYYTPLPTPAEMGAWDQAAIQQYGVKNEILMENASREALAVLEEEKKLCDRERVVLLAGKGNNGGDAIALARHLHDRGIAVLLLLAAPLSHYKGVSGYHLRLARRTGTPMAQLANTPPEKWGEATVLVDGLLGTGFKGALRAPYASWIEAINQRREHAFILALDIPSGLDGMTGKASPIAVRANATVTFQAAKIGLVLPEAQDFVGRLHVRHIGIPARILEDAPPSYGLLDARVAGLLPPPSSTMHKGNGGRVCIIGGSRGLSGGAHLAGLGALRAGAGLVTVACPAGITTEVKQGAPELMVLPLPHETSKAIAWNAEDLASLKDFINGCDALVVGPGWGRTPEMQDCLERILQWQRPSAVLDADALFALAERPGLCSLLKEGDVLTPHPGEMARLLGTSTATVQSDRAGIAKTFAKEHGVTLVLKGAGSLVAKNGYPLLVSPFATPALAIGGAGDVLSGIIATLMARGLSDLRATCLAVYWHGFAGVRLEREYPLRGNFASEIAHALPGAIKEFSA